MKTLYYLICIPFFICINVQNIFGQIKPTIQKIDKKIDLTTADSVRKPSRIDIVINMDMIASFRRCYDRIEVIDWASLLRNVSADEIGMIYIAYCKMKTSENNLVSTEKLISEAELLKKGMLNDTAKIVEPDTKTLNITAGLFTEKH